jgi:hypothetical protein
MIQALNNRAIAARGVFVGPDDDFEIVRCASCGCQYLYNDEILMLYLEPTDLSQHVFYIEGETIPPCRRCKKVGWTIESIPDEDVESAVEGPWSWSL